jgi:hypothetical protein
MRGPKRKRDVKEVYLTPPTDRQTAAQDTAHRGRTEIRNRFGFRLAHNTESCLMAGIRISIIVMTLGTMSYALLKA